jgi:hypothetical protein
MAGIRLEAFGPADQVGAFHAAKQHMEKKLTDSTSRDVPMICMERCSADPHKVLEYFKMLCFPRWWIPGPKKDLESMRPLRSATENFNMKFTTQFPFG